MMIVGGCFAVVINVPYLAPATTPIALPQIVYPRHTWPAWMFLAAVVGAAFGSMVLRRSKPRNLFYLGLLIGVGVTALCEGACFLAQ